MFETPTESCDCQACAEKSARVERQTGLLQELAEIGMVIARKVRGEAEQEDAQSDSLALTFARVSRAIRQTLALETQIAEGTLPHPVRKSAKQRYLDYRRSRDHKAATVDDAIRSLEGGDREDLDDRIDDSFEAFADKPISVWIAAIAKDLGLQIDWALFADEDWAAEEAVTFPDSPFKAFGPKSSPTGGGGPRSGGGGCHAPPDPWMGPPPPPPDGGPPPP